ncbi:hypothetical protein BDQ17DRAFT_1373310 [Cyathus striatus]|nr:hypothetical protein BDQ17DRAFT_1373310 [Cyathus striatus]
MRTTTQIYQLLLSYLTAADAAHPDGYDLSIEVHFRSGVSLGRQGCYCVLGGWEGSGRPSVGAESEDVRRSVCDMALLIFHLILSSPTFQGVDINVAQHIIEWNLKRYPNGELFLFFVLVTFGLVGE